MTEKSCNNCKYTMLAAYFHPCVTCYDYDSWKPVYTEHEVTKPKKPTVTKAEILRRLEALEKLAAAAQVTVRPAEASGPEGYNPWDRKWCHTCEHRDVSQYSYPCNKCVESKPTKWEKKS